MAVRTFSLGACISSLLTLAGALPAIILTAEDIRGALSSGCGFECTEDMGSSTCNVAKGEHCRSAIVEASYSTEEIESVEFPAKERWDSVYAAGSWENLTIWFVLRA